MENKLIVERGSVSKLYRISCSFYPHDVYAYKWKDVIDFLKHNIGYEYEIKCVTIQNLPYGFYIMHKGKCYSAEYDEVEGNIIAVDDTIKDVNGERIKVGMKVKLVKDNESCNEDSEMKSKIVYNVEAVYDKVYISSGYSVAEVYGNEVKIISTP